MPVENETFSEAALAAAGLRGNGHATPLEIFTFCVGGGEIGMGKWKYDSEW